MLKTYNSHIGISHMSMELYSNSHQVNEENKSMDDKKKFASINHMKIFSSINHMFTLSYIKCAVELGQQLNGTG